jgi:pimeloyl-ACP methyl ester carboxylesterase
LLKSLACGQQAACALCTTIWYSKTPRRKHRPPTLIVWGKNDKIFPADGAHPYKRDLPGVEFHLIDTGHFALEDKADEMVPLIRDFLGRNVKRI